MTNDLLQPPTDLPPVDENKNYLSDLVGEGKKFKTVEDLAKSKVHADATIDVMTRRLDELTEDYKKTRTENITKAKLEEMLDQIANQKQLGINTPPPEAPNTPQWDAKELDGLLDTKIKAREVEKQQQANADAVVSKLKQQYGDNYQATVTKQIETLGLSSEDFNALARKSPSALFRTLGLDQTNQENFQAPFRSSQRNDNFAPTGAPKRTWAYYQELKKKDPQLYYDRNIAVQMAKDAVELGEAFRDGNYYTKGLHED